MDITGQIIFLNEIKSCPCPAMIRVCGLVTYIDYRRMICQISDPTTCTTTSTTRGSPDSSSRLKKSIYTHDDATNNLSCSSPSKDMHIPTLLVRCDRVGIADIDLYKLKTYIGELREEFIDLDTNVVDDRREYSCVASEHISSGAAPKEDLERRNEGKKRVLVALTAVSSDGLDYLLYRRVVMKRRQFL